MLTRSFLQIKSEDWNLPPLPSPLHPITPQISKKDTLIGAMLCDGVYHTEESRIHPSFNYEIAEEIHNPTVGYRAEIWYQKSDSGQVERVYVVQRGTPLTRPEGMSEEQHLNELWANIVANIQITSGAPSPYMAYAQRTCQKVIEAHPGIPTHVTGHSLAGAIVLPAVLWARQNGHTNVTGIAYNAPVSRALPEMDLLTHHQRRQAEGSVLHLYNYDDPLRRLLGERYLTSAIKAGFVSHVEIPHMPEIPADYLTGHLPSSAAIGFAYHCCRKDEQEAAMRAIRKWYLPKRPAGVDAVIDNYRRPSPSLGRRALLAAGA